MNVVYKAPLSTAAKIFLGVAIFVGVIHMIDFIFYGHEIRNLLTSVGFTLMGFGVYKNDFRSARDAGEGGAVIDQPARFAMVIGLVLALIAFVMDYLA